MGRAARAKQERTTNGIAPIRLTDVEFWHMRARAEEAARAQQEAAVTPQALEAVQAGRRAAEALDALAKKYGFDASLELTFDESTLSLVPKPAPQTPQK